MFDLETKILEWRKTMLSAGIKSPVPLDELESHLRERFSDLKTGLSESDAFQTAVKELGDGKILKKEFAKGRFVWRVRTNPLALNILGVWFILGGLNDFLQLVWMGRFAPNLVFSFVGFVLAIVSLQTFVGIGLLYRAKFWHRCAIIFCAIGIAAMSAEILGELWPAAGRNLQNSYFIFMGAKVPMSYELPTDILNLSMLVWAIYVLTRSSMKNLFRAVTVG